MTDELSIKVDGKSIAGWTEVNLTRGIENFPSSFDIGMTEKYPGAADMVIVAGKPCEVWIGTTKVLTGYVDQYTANIINDSHEVRIRGRSKCEDVVDCSAFFGEGRTATTQIRDETIVQLATRLCDPFGIKVVNLAGDDGPKIPGMSVNIGETVFEILEPVARWVGFLIYDDVDGNLVFSRVGKQSMTSGFQQAKNVQAANFTLRTDQRFTDYYTLWQATSVQGDLQEALQATGNNRHGYSVDHDLKGVGRYRPYYIISSMMDASMVAIGQNPDLGQRMADWDNNRRWGRGQVISLVTDSWRDPADMKDRKLWEPNYLATVEMPSIKVNKKKWIIASVTYQRNLNSGTTAQVVMMPPEAFDIEPLSMTNASSDQVAALQKSKHLDDIRSQIKTVTTDNQKAAYAQGNSAEESGSPAQQNPAPAPPPTPAPSAPPPPQPQAATGTPQVALPQDQSVKDYGTPEMELPVPAL